MQFEIESDRELTEGLPPTAIWRPGFPNRLIKAHYQGVWKTAEQFDVASIAEITPVFHEFFRTLGFFENAPAQPWPELSYESAQYLVCRFVKQSQAYDIELRNSEDAQRITSTIVPNEPHIRYFSNHDVLRRGEQIASYVCPGFQLTFHTFEFAIVSIRPESIVLFLTCDED